MEMKSLSSSVFIEGRDNVCKDLIRSLREWDKKKVKKKKKKKLSLKSLTDLDSHWCEDERCRIKFIAAQRELKICSSGVTRVPINERSNRSNPL